jgi:hypothetical protein
VAPQLGQGTPNVCRKAQAGKSLKSGAANRASKKLSKKRGKITALTSNGREILVGAERPALAGMEEGVRMEKLFKGSTD